VLYLLKPTEDKKKYEPFNVGKFEDRKAVEAELNYGMIAERTLQDGDYVLFNRQPTLHRMSMMCHRVKILPHSTFRLNLSVCTPYNADFDGDEMNMHVPQSYESLAELKHIAHVGCQIVTPKNNAPVMGIVQDSLLGIYLFTQRSTFLTREQMMNLVVWIEDFEGDLPLPAVIKPVPLWSGKQVISLLINRRINISNLKGDIKDLNPKDNSILIHRGELLTGALTKEIVGSGAGGLVHILWLDISPQVTCDFMTMAQRIVNTWLVDYGFTCGASDVVPPAECAARMAIERGKVLEVFNETYRMFFDEKLLEENNLMNRTKRVIDSLEIIVNEKLNKVLRDARNVIEDTVSTFTNNLYKMISARSKGSETNLTQILGMLGNQNVDGQRLPQGFSRRALCHFHKDDYSPEARGFIFSSFYQGLTAQEFYFHSMSGREGLSDTAVKTSRTGYIQRKLIKALEDVITKYDATVRDSQNSIVQRLYGEDSMCA
jgi:DNA-directed RNA polymerase II subunit RPB1